MRLCNYVNSNVYIYWSLNTLKRKQSIFKNKHYILHEHIEFLLQAREINVCTDVRRRFDIRH